MPLDQPLDPFLPVSLIAIGSKQAVVGKKEIIFTDALADGVGHLTVDGESSFIFGETGTYYMSFRGYLKGEGKVRVEGLSKELDKYNVFAAKGDIDIVTLLPIVGGQRVSLTISSSRGGIMGDGSRLIIYRVA